jgi:hypothetical protein
MKVIIIIIFNKKHNFIIIIMIHFLSFKTIAMCLVTCERSFPCRSMKLNLSETPLENLSVLVLTVKRCDLYSSQESAAIFICFPILGCGFYLAIEARSDS